MKNVILVPRNEDPKKIVKMLVEDVNAGVFVSEAIMEKCAYGITNDENDITFTYESVFINWSLVRSAKVDGKWYEFSRKPADVKFYDLES